MLSVLRKYTRIRVLSRAYVRPFSSGSDRPNQPIIDLLDRYIDQENQSATRNPYKIRAFSSAIKVINQLDYPIRSAAEAKALKGVGVGITRRIEAFLSGVEYEPTDVDVVHDRVKRKAEKGLELVPGIGPKKARKLVEAGCQHISDLHQPKYLAMLTPTMQIGLKYYSHLSEPVTREEAETVMAFIREHISPKFETHIAGSYRRGSQTSSDIDLIFLHPSHVHVPTPTLPDKGRLAQPSRSTSTLAQRAASPLINDVVKPLEEAGVLAAALSCGPRKWQGVVRVPKKNEGVWEDRGSRLAGIRAGTGVYRRADFNFVPMKSRGAGLLALTGDVEFNKDIRNRATKLGMHLNEFGLWRWQPDDDTSVEEEEEKKGFWELIRAGSEEEILKEVGLDYIEPEKRNFGFVLGKTRKPRK